MQNVICASATYHNSIELSSLQDFTTAIPCDLLVRSNTLLAWTAARTANKTQVECLSYMEHDFLVTAASKKSVVCC